MKNVWVGCLLFLLVACGAPADAPTPAPTAKASAASAIQVMIGSDDFAVGQPRVPLLLFADQGRVLDAQRVKVTVFDLAVSPAKAGWNGEATHYRDYAFPYWIIYPTLPTAGEWGLYAEITQADGTTTVSRAVIQVNAQNSAPTIGDQPPASQSRTLQTEPDIRKLTSAAQPNPAFYAMTVAEALRNGRPSVIVFATPGFCETALCTPVLQSAETLYPRFRDRVNFVHIEVYKQFTPQLVLDDTMLEWRLRTEPWTFVLDQQGIISSRLGGPVSPQELEQALQELLG